MSRLLHILLSHIPTRRDEHRNGWGHDPRFLIEKVMGIPLCKGQTDIIFGPGNS
jgi:hypothetical protein